MSCSAFAIEVVDKEESAEVQKRVGEFRVALRKFVVALKLSDVRFEALVKAADEAWRPILPKPKARSVRDVLFEAFSAENKADALDDYIIMFDKESLTFQALDAAPEYAQLSTVLQALIAVSRFHAQGRGFEPDLVRSFLSELSRARIELIRHIFAE